MCPFTKIDTEPRRDCCPLSAGLGPGLERSAARRPGRPAEHQVPRRRGHARDPGPVPPPPGPATIVLCHATFLFTTEFKLEGFPFAFPLSSRAEAARSERESERRAASASDESVKTRSGKCISPVVCRSRSTLNPSFFIRFWYCWPFFCAHNKTKPQETFS